MDHLHTALIALEALVAQVNLVDESNNNNPGVLLQNGMWEGGEIQMVGDGDEGSDGSIGLAATLHSTFAVGTLSSPHNDAAKVSVLLQRMDLPEEFERTLAEIAMLCATLPGRRGREFKDELRRQGAIERWVTAAGSHGQHHSHSKARNERIGLFNGESKRGEKERRVRKSARERASEKEKAREQPMIMERGEKQRRKRIAI